MIESIQIGQESVSNVVVNDKLKYINTVLSISCDQEGELINQGINFSDPKVDSRGTPINKSKVWHKCMLIVAKQSFVAGKAEHKAARKDFENEELSFTNLDYLKEYPKRFGSRFKGLYEGVHALIDKYHHSVENGIFATHQFSRKTMNVPPARLGIRSEFRDKTMFAQQYPIKPCACTRVVRMAFVCVFWQIFSARSR